MSTDNIIVCIIIFPCEDTDGLWTARLEGAEGTVETLPGSHRTADRAATVARILWGDLPSRTFLGARSIPSNAFAAK